MHGPYGVAFYAKNTSGRPDADIEKDVLQNIHPLLKSLAGFQSVVYYNVDEMDYYFVISFADEASTDQALEKLKGLAASEPGARVEKAEVVTGELVDRLLAGEQIGR